MTVEPTITINGVSLNAAQANTVRCAIADFLMQLADPEFMRLLGPIGPLYRESGIEIERIMGVRK
jgi:hypothetical protein